MTLHWCLSASGIQDPNDPNNYGVYSCRSLCEHVWDKCGANKPNSTYQWDKFSGCLTPSRIEPYDTWFPPGGTMRACFDENLKIRRADCANVTGYQCLNGGRWQAVCMGCICPPGYGGYNCGRCSSTGASIPGAAPRTDGSTLAERTALATKACADMCNTSISTATCMEYKTFGNLLLPNNATVVPVFECPMSLKKTLFPSSALAGGYVTMTLDMREKDAKSATGSLNFSIYSPQAVWNVGFENQRQVECRGEQCRQVSAEKCNQVQSKVKVQKGDSCFKCVYAGCQCTPNAVANQPPSDPYTPRCTFFNKPLDYKKPVNAHAGCDSSTGECFISAGPNILPVPIVFSSCQSSTCKITNPEAQGHGGTCQPLVRHETPSLGPIWIIFYAMLAFTAVLTGCAAARSGRRRGRGNEVVDLGEPGYVPLIVQGDKVPAAAIAVFENVGCRLGGMSILAHVTGRASTADGGVYAIMGPSGAGKTTLLDVLAGRKASKDCAGALVVDGVHYRTMASRRNAFGYVLQDDSTLPPFLTVREAIEFSASLRLPPGTPSRRREKIVDRVVRQLGLEKVAESRIGEVGASGISGGERRRVSIGMELVVGPKVLLLDEPTSGLDAAAALKVVEILTGLVRRGECLVIATIHQPRPDAFSSFGRVLLLSDGAAAYEGPPLGVAEALGAVGRACPAHVNLADFALDVMAGLTPTERMFLLQTEATDVPAEGRVAEKGRGGGGRCGRALCLLAELERKALCRAPRLVAVHLALSALMGGVVGGVYYGMKVNLKGTLNRLFSLFTMMTFVALMGTSAVSLFQGTAKLRFLRERASGYYTTLPYTVSKVLFDDLFLRLAPCACFVAIAYAMVDYGRVYTEADFYNATTGTMTAVGSICARTGIPLQLVGSCAADMQKGVAAGGYAGLAEMEAEYAAYRSVYALGLLLYLTASVASGICSVVGVATATNRTGSFVSVLLILLFIMFSGALINNNLLREGGWGVNWVRIASPFGYAFEGMIIGQMEGQCFFFDPRNSYAPGKEASALACAEVSGQTWLLNIGCSPVGEVAGGGCRFDPHTIQRDIFALLGLRAVLFALLYLALRFKEGRR
jgi:ABC-type multidrug transport system ATPase subunit